jgi:hypothetical protein
VQGLSGAHNMPWDVSLPEDATRQEANRAHNKKFECEKRENKPRVPPDGRQKREGGYPTESDSLDEEEANGEVIAPSLSPPCVTPPLFWRPPEGVLAICLSSHLSLTWFWLLLPSFLNSKCDFWMT